MKKKAVACLFVCAIVCTLGLCSSTHAQTVLASVTGRVLDPNAAVIVEASVAAKNVDTGIETTVQTNEEGIYHFADLGPGNYEFSVSKRGFKVIVKPGVTLHVADTVSMNFTMQVGDVRETVTVEAGAPLINTESAAVSTVVDRQFAENLPMNGRSFQTLIQLTPGVVSTAYSNFDNGQFSVNGQRAASNYWTVDGVSANVGVGTSMFSAGNGLAGANASLSVLGGTNSLVSVDALQEFRIQTSTFAPEFGRTPGGQISIVTRSGGNQWHGSAFDYLRNDVLDANDWFANFNHLAKPEERQNDFGGTFSGPVLKDRTFFFFSYEGLRLRLPQVAESLVPDISARQSAVPAMQPFLNAFPLPTANTPDDLTNEIAHFNASYSNSATLDAYSLRVDHKLGDKLILFGRYNYSPSTSSQRGANLGPLNSVTPSQINLQTATVGVTRAITPTTINDLRFNYSRTHSKSHSFLDRFGGGVPLASLPFPSGFNADNGLLALLWIPLSFSGPNPGFEGDNLQRQINLVDDVTFQKGSHNLKFGVDFRRLSPVFGNAGYTQEVLFADVPSSTSGNFGLAFVSSGRGGTFSFHNLGAFGQDTWRVRPALTVTYGLRWDMDFAPSSSPALLAVTGFDPHNLSTLGIAPAGTPPFQTTYGNLAPRIGVAYHLSGDQKLATVLRGGFGVFYDLATSEAGNLSSPGDYPFGASNLIFGTVFGGTSTFPLSSSDAAPPPITATSPISRAFAFDPHLKLPYVLQWNVAVEQALGSEQTLSATYVGSAGRRLIQSAKVLSPNASFGQINLTTNAATSDYDALQLQFQRRLSHGLQSLISYTWSHSIDTASAGSFGNNANALLPGVINLNRGPSDFDIRDGFSAGVTYDVPAPKVNAFTNAMLRGWSVQSIVQARSAPPVTVYDSLFLGFLNNDLTLIRPDVVAGQPFYLYGPQYPGGKAFNANAFTPPPTDAAGNPLRQGDLGRNALRGFGATQWDFAVHRDFPIRESLKLQFRAELFNVLNHPNFAPPVADINNTTQFGLSTQTLGNFLAGGNVGSGALSPLYQIGGPRSVQFGLKLQF